ncbi:hypothetical protein HPHPA11_1416 [Helicobacter pylori Hp A-11]|uniref:Uncharacterized protein n=1 Tax=Helicobacter pylori Hp A-11 TaxID=992035 RepID=N4TRM9_HELPX|nr:hypothetical protein HPHPA11_1416 [Helicobacter pylori Hp A-11]
MFNAANLLTQSSLMEDWVGLRFFVCFVLKMAQNLFCFITFRFLALAALSAYICSRGLKILGFWVFQ